MISSAVSTSIIPLNLLQSKKAFLSSSSNQLSSSATSSYPSPSLKDNHTSLYKFTIVDLFEISTAAYSIWNIMNDAETRNLSVENELSSKCRKLLKLKLSDGHSEFHALEYTKINGLSLLTTIGTKILVKEAVIRNGMLILKGKDVQITEEPSVPLEERIFQLKIKLCKHLKLDPPTRKAVKKIHHPPRITIDEIDGTQEETVLPPTTQSQPQSLDNFHSFINSNHQTNRPTPPSTGTNWNNDSNIHNPHNSAFGTAHYGQSNNFNDTVPQDTFTAAASKSNYQTTSNRSHILQNLNPFNPSNNANALPNKPYICTAAPLISNVPKHNNHIVINGNDDEFNLDSDFDDPRLLAQIEDTLSSIGELNQSNNSTTKQQKCTSVIDLTSPERFNSGDEAKASYDLNFNITRNERRLESLSNPTVYQPQLSSQTVNYSSSSAPNIIRPTQKEATITKQFTNDSNYPNLQSTYFSSPNMPFPVSSQTRKTFHIEDIFGIPRSQPRIVPLMVKVNSHSKLRMDKQLGFTLPIKIYDETSDLDVILGNDIMEKLLGLSLEHVNKLKVTAEGRKKVVESSNQLSGILDKFHSSMSIQISPPHAHINQWPDLQNYYQVMKMDF